MAQSGFTPISLYFSATSAAVPSAGNLVAGELALNTNDGKLYYKNSSGVVTLLAGATSGPAGGSTTQVQYNNAGVLAGITGATTNGTALTLTAPVLGTPASATLTNATGLPISSGVSGLGTGVATALGVNTGSAGAMVLFNGALGTPTSGTVTNLTGTASININGTVGATTPAAGAFTTLSATGAISNSSGFAGAAIALTGAGTATRRLDITTTGAIINIGAESSGGGGIIASSTSYALALNTGNTAPVQIGVNSVLIGSFTTTGLAVTGTLSASGTAEIGIATSVSYKALINLRTADTSTAGAFASSALNVWNPTTVGTYSQITFGYNSLGLTYAAAYFGLVSTATTAGGYGDLVFGVRAVGTDTQATERARISSTGLAVTGTLSATTGAAVGGATAGAGGVAFPATAVAVADANTLDDYEEGTWTPTLTPATSGTITLGSPNLCAYTKIGRIVTVNGLIDTASVSAPVGSSVTFNNLPFTSNATGTQRSAGAAVCFALSSGTVTTNLVIVSSTTSFVVQINASLFQAGSQVYFQLSYTF